MAYTTRLGLRDELRAASERGVGRNCDERGAESAGGWYIITTNNIITYAVAAAAATVPAARYESVAATQRREQLRSAVEES